MPEERNEERAEADHRESTQRTGSVPREILAASALLALAFGVPGGLWALTGPPVPTGLPTREFLTQPIELGTVITLSVAVVWIAWAHFMMCLLAELLAVYRTSQGRGGRRQQVWLRGPTFLLVRALVGAVFVTGVTVGPSYAASETGGDRNAVTLTELRGERDRSPEGVERQPTQQTGHTLSADDPLVIELERSERRGLVVRLELPVVLSGGVSVAAWMALLGADALDVSLILVLGIGMVLAVMIAGVVVHRRPRVVSAREARAMADDVWSEVSTARLGTDGS